MSKVLLMLGTVGTAAVLLSGFALAGEGHGGPPSDPPDEWTYKFLGGSTTEGTVTYGPITLTFSVTITSCAADGDNCRETGQGYVAK